jgi:hypothetical protein
MVASAQHQPVGFVAELMREFGIVCAAGDYDFDRPGFEALDASHDLPSIGNSSARRSFSRNPSAECRDRSQYLTAK